MPTPDREPIKQALAAYLKAALETVNNFADGKPVRKVYPYLTPEFLDGLPVVCVTTATGGSEPSRLAFGSGPWHQTLIYLDVVTYVEVASADGTQTQATAEAQSNKLAATIGDVLAGAASGPNWKELVFAARSQAVQGLIGAEVYIVESFPLKMRALQ